MNFWKKTGHKLIRKSQSVDELDTSPKTTNFRCLQNQQLQELFLKELPKIDCSTPIETSRLSKSLIEVLRDKCALSYFIQYLETRNALSYVKFWLDVESFNSSIKSTEIPPKTCIPYEELEPQLPSTKSQDSLSLSVSTDGDSLTIDEYPLSPKPSQLHDILEDATRIYKKYIGSNIIRISDEQKNNLKRKLCDEFRVSCFLEIQEMVLKMIEMDYFDGFLRTDFYCKYQVEVLTSGHVTLQDILYNETALFYFMEFMEQEQCRDLLQFWISMTNFTCNSHLNDQIQNDAIVLYDRYFSLQALTPLGFPDPLRLEIEENICNETGVPKNCFIKPIKLVEAVMENYYLKSFLTSELFYKYLSELISAMSPTLTRHRRFGSDASSEISCISAHNTLLAMEDKKKRRRKNGETDMSIDTRHLFDPDSLWRRNQMGLMLGRVTELGRFETAIEPQPDKKGDSKIGSIVKRLVNFSEDKAKEEMAWQIAEMIVKDITSLTLSESPPY